MLEGTIGEDFKWSKAQNGAEYATFSLCMNSYIKEIADSTEKTHSRTYIRIFVYDKKQLEYLKRVKVKRGQRIAILGRLTSAKNEYKGITYMSNNVTCRDISIIKTRKEKENGRNELCEAE